MSSDRDRLIELIKQATTSHLDYLESIDQKGLTDTEGRAKFIADYLLAKGVIVPPCKVGDNIYFIERHPERLGGTKINKAEVVSMKANISHKSIGYWLFVTYRDINGNDTCGEILYGKTAFKTKEEAEAKLKELSK